MKLLISLALANTMEAGGLPIVEQACPEFDAQPALDYSP
jgi:hypothetical protein